MNVFDKLDAAEKALRGVTLNLFELWVLMDKAGEAIAVAGSSYAGVGGFYQGASTDETKKRRAA